jgi:hypothetical protein
MSECENLRAKFALMLYGELTFDQEEHIESHLDACAECQAALERQRAIHTAFDHVERVPAGSFLEECRHNFAERLADERANPAPQPPPTPAASGWWDKFVDALTLRPSAGIWRPVGALTLVALGFFAARIAPEIDSRWIPLGIAGTIPGHVHYVDRGNDGRVRIVVDETRERVVAGTLDQRPIRALLLTAAKDPNDPGLRVRTLDLLQAQVKTAEIRDIVLDRLEHDPNDGVRLKAMDVLKPFVQEPDVRNAFRYVLLADSNRGLRSEAMDVLVGGDHPVLDQQMVGTLQELMERGEQLNYVRQRAVTLLRTVNASVEVY